MAKTFEESADSFHHCMGCGFLFHCARSCLERSPVEDGLSSFRLARYQVGLTSW
jgi:hypothetical protein